MQFDSTALRGEAKKVKFPYVYIKICQKLHCVFRIH